MLSCDENCKTISSKLAIAFEVSIVLFDFISFIMQLKLVGIAELIERSRSIGSVFCTQNQRSNIVEKTFQFDSRGRCFRYARG